MIVMLKAWAILAVAVLLTSVVLRPGMRLKNWQTAFAVAAVFGVLKVLFLKLLILITLPAWVLTFGLFTFVLLAVLLAITDAVVDGFKMKSFGWTLMAALLISVFDRVGHFLF